MGEGSPPPTRGALAASDLAGALPGITPAYAGSTRGPPSPTTCSWDHPRLRGEHQWRGAAPEGELGSPPPTRGARSRTPAGPQGPGITPAYAGSTVKGSIMNDLIPDHPRLRGEHAAKPPQNAAHEGSPPPTRGAQAGHQRAGHRVGITPAYAGSTVRTRRCRRARRDHPRLRGEHSEIGSRPRRGRGSPPPTRGARSRDSCERDDDGITPAYAGSTMSGLAGLARLGDHPRLRGEHGFLGIASPSRLGSPPPTRGARHVFAAQERLVGITPAYAGSTA